MANSKAIKSQIKSIWNIQKITSALEIVSTVKLQKLKEQTDNFKEYMNHFMFILGNIWYGSDMFSFTKDIKSEKELIVVVSTEKWLCWALNSKLFRKIYNETKDRKENIDVFCIWKKALEFFTRSWYNIVWSEQIKDKFWEDDLKITKSIVFDGIENLKYKSIDLYYNYFKNSMTQEPSLVWLFPLTSASVDSFFENIGVENKYKSNDSKDVHIEPSAEDFYEFVYKKFVFDMIYGSLLQNKTWEHAARMIAMKNAKDNSVDIQKSLKVTYNKQRQSAVTQEISEIVWAKAAME